MRVQDRLLDLWQGVDLWIYVYSSWDGVCKGWFEGGEDEEWELWGEV